MAAQTATKISRIDASYYTVKDLDALTKFYGSILGFEPTLAMPGFVSEWTFAGGETFGLYKSPEGKSSGSGVMFGVDDLKSKIAECKGLGIELEDGGTIEDTPVCFMAFAQDPEGNHF